MKKTILKIFWLVNIIIEVVIFLIVNFAYKDTYEVYNSTNYLVLIIIEIVNIIFGILLLRKSESKIVFILYIIFVIITLFIPIYHNGNTYAPTGQDSHLMGLAFKERFLNIYGINIIKLIK